MDFSLDDEQKMVQQTVRQFVNRELIPLEGQALLNEREGRPALGNAEQKQRYLLPTINGERRSCFAKGNVKQGEAF